MKKLVSILLALVLALGCACAFAEGNDDSAYSDFLQIREGVTANVYEKPGDEEAAATLAEGTFCMLIQENAVEGKTWYYVFYLNSEKKGAIGYIDAEDAERLTENKLKTLMEDEEKCNVILDLLDALNEYLKAGENKNTAGTDKTGTDPAGTGNTGTGNSSGLKDQFDKLYNQAMDMLKGIFDTDVSAALDGISDIGEELAGKAADVGKDLIESVGEGAKDLVGDLTDKAKEELEELLPEAKEKLGELADKAKEEMEEFLPEAKEKLGDLADKAKEELEELAPEAKEKMDDLADQVQETLDSLKDGDWKEDLDGLLDKVTDTIESLEGEAGAKLQDVRKEMEDKLAELDASVGEGTGSALDKLDQALEDIQEKTEDLQTIVSPAIQEIGESFSENGFSGGAKTMLDKLLEALGKDE